MGKGKKGGKKGGKGSKKAEKAPSHGHGWYQVGFIFLELWKSCVSGYVQDFLDVKSDVEF